jgi:DNA-binding CsgD family transcriptional regulator
VAVEVAAVTAWTFAQEIPIPEDVGPLLVDGERPVAAFKTFRDSAVFTTKRLIVRHVLRAEPAGDPSVVDLLRAAATTAYDHGAPDTAALYLHRALEEPPHQVPHAAVLLELGRAEASAADPGAPTHLAEAYRLAADPLTRADAAQQAALCLFASGRVDEAIGMLGAVVEEDVAAGQSDRALELEAELLSLALLTPHEWSIGTRHLPRLARVDEGLVGATNGARMMLCLLAFWRTWRSHGAGRATELVERALVDGLLLAKRGPEALQFSQASMTLVCADRLESATELIDAALILARERGSRWGFWVASFLRSQLAYRQGALAEVEADAHGSLAVTVPAGAEMASVAATAMLMAALLERGALAEAAAALDAIGFAQGDMPQQPLPYNLLLIARSRLRLARGDVSGGLADIHECGRRNVLVEARNSILFPWRVDAALAHRGRGELDAARALAQDELAAAHDWGTPGAIGSAQRLAGLLSEGDEAIDLLREAVAALAMSPARLEHARALVDLGAALRRTNHRIDAREPLSQGLDLASRCGAAVLRQRACDELAAMGARPRRIRITGIDALTASERRVARMAGGGLSNVEIAQQLFVTRKTVEKHLGNAYRKLGVNSREALSVRLSGQEEGANSVGISVS